MGDFYSGGRGSGISSIVCSDVRSWSYLLEFTPFHSLVDGIFVRLVSLTSCISHRFIRFIEDLAVRDERRKQDSENSFCEQHIRYVYHPYQYDLGECSASSSSSNPVNHNTHFSVCSRRVTDCKENSSITTCTEIVGSRHSWNDSFILKGLVLPLHGFKFGWRLTSTSLRSFFIYVRNAHIQVQSFVSRLQRTLEGSSEDIGWLERTPGLPPVENGTSRFFELLESIRNGEHSLPNSFIYLLVPGLFSNHSPLYLVNTKRFFSKMGLACHIAKIHSEASVEKNSWELKQYIEELYWGSGKRVVILGHSKGGVDAAAALSLYWPELKNMVAGLALVQSPYGGTPIASDLLREGQVAHKEAWRLVELLVCKLIKGDMRALVDLTYDKRKDFIARHRLPADEIPVVSFHTEAGITPGVLATMSHIAHAELPWLPLPRFISEAEAESNSLKVPVVIPLSAVMAVTALHLRLRYGEKSDGLVTRRDAEVPGSVVVRPDRKLSHVWMVYSSMGKDDVEADASEMCEALLTMLIEIGKKKH